MARKLTKKQEDSLYRRMARIIKKYGSAKIILKRGSSEYGLRLIRKSGRCKISYSQTDSYKKSYQTSCFVDDYYNDGDTCCSCGSKARLSLAQTLKAMRRHDNTYISIAEVAYGPKYGRKLRLKL
jgi:hypothetical protein